MSTLTEGKVVGDVVLHERDANGSREELLVDQGQTLVIGTVVRDGDAGRKVALGTLLNEVQRVINVGTAMAAGTFRIALTHPDSGQVFHTAEMAHDASTADIETAIELLGGAADIADDDIKITGTDVDDFTVTFSGGRWAGKAIAPILVHTADDATAGTRYEVREVVIGGSLGGTIVNEIQTATWNDTATGGTFTVRARDAWGVLQTTGTIAYDATDAVGQTALDEAFGSGRIAFTSLSTTVLVLTWSGPGMAGRNQDPITFPTFPASVTSATIVETAAGSGLSGNPANEVQTATFDTAATAGTFTVTALDHSGTSVTTGDIDWNDTAAAMQAVLDTAFGTDRIISALLAGANVDDGFVLTFSGAGFSGVDQPLITVDVSALTSVTSTAVVETVKGGGGGGGGLQEADAICIKAVTTVSGEITTKTVFLTDTAVVNEDQLAFGSGDKDAAIRSLKSNHIMMRKQPTTTETQTS